MACRFVFTDFGRNPTNFTPPRPPKRQSLNSEQAKARNGCRPPPPLPPAATQRRAPPPAHRPPRAAASLSVGRGPPALMGSAESSLSQQLPDDEITTVSQRVEGVDPLLEKLQALRIAEPLLKSGPPSESSLTDILVRKPSSSSLSGSLNPKVLLELFSMYRDWQEEKAKEISQKQEEIENKIEMADALALKLFQRFNYSVSGMKTAAHNLAEVHPLQVEVGELKGRLTEVISNCDALCRRISTEGPNLLQFSVKPFSTNDLERDPHDINEDAHSASLDKDITTSTGC